MFPRWLMADAEFSKMSNDAKVLYMILKDRFKLSSKNHWIDKEGRVYLICRRESMCELLHKSKNTVTTIVNELIKYNLIEEKHIGFSKPNYIYLLMPQMSDEPELKFDEDNYQGDDVVEQSEDAKPKKHKGASASHSPKNWDNGFPKIGTHSNNNFSNNINNNILFNNNNNSNTVVVKDIDYNMIDSIVFNSIEFKRNQEAGGECFEEAAKAKDRLIKNIKTLKKTKKLLFAMLSESDIEDLFDCSLKVTRDVYDTFNNPDGYIVSKINEKLENMQFSTSFPQPNREISPNLMENGSA